MLRALLDRAANKFSNARGIRATSQKRRPPSLRPGFPELRARRTAGRVLTADAIHCNSASAIHRNSLMADTSSAFIH
jgi:hypothetical protein